MKIFNTNLNMANLDNIPQPIKDVIDSAAYKYAESPSTTNAGFILRFICKFIKPSTIIKMFAHKIAK